MNNQDRKALIEALNKVAHILANKDVRVKTAIGPVHIAAIADQPQISAMAMDREMFMDRIIEKLQGACHEGLKALVAKRELEARTKAGKAIPKDLRAQKWVDHWNAEQDQLLEQQLPLVMGRKVKFSSKGREKAALQALEEFSTESFWSTATSAMNAVKKDYGLQYLLSEVTTEDQNAFVAKAKTVIQSAGHEF
jgi:hypothetical protein